MDVINIKNFKKLAIVLLLICVVACTVASVSATSKVSVEKDTKTYAEESNEVKVNCAPIEITLPDGRTAVVSPTTDINLIIRSLNNDVIIKESMDKNKNDSGNTVAALPVYPTSVEFHDTYYIVTYSDGTTKRFKK